MNRSFFLMIYIIIVFIITILGMIFLINQGEESIENENLNEYNITVENLQAFLFFILGCIILGFFLIRRYW
jgi:hypothetical protein